MKQRAITCCIKKANGLCAPEGVFKLDENQREANVGNLREWSLTSLAENRPAIHKQFCLYGLSEVNQPLAKFTTG